MTQARLVVQGPDGTELDFTLAEPEISLGRHAENDVVLEDPIASRKHAVIRTREDGAHVLFDLGSANGTRLGEKRIELPTQLIDGDVFEIAGYRLTYVDDRSRQGGDDPTSVDDRTLMQEVPDPRQIIGTSPGMVRVFELIDQAAASPIPVLVEGETGTGKELVARAIHRASDRSDGPFIAVNCAAISENLFESELFGHKKGAFTGATQDRKGVFEDASGGCIFLDEIGEMPISMQPKLLRVLQEGEVTPVGETRPRPIDVRIISATNRDLVAQSEEGSFRSDLYYRLAGFPISIPPLRERREDIPLIAERLLVIAAGRHEKQLRGIASDAMNVLSAFDWPGNVRELQNEIGRAVARTREGERVRAAQLSDRIRDHTPVQGANPRASAPTSAAKTETGEPAPLRDARAAFESKYIAQVLQEQGGNVTRAAQVLGISRYALQKKIKEYGLKDPPAKPAADG